MVVWRICKQRWSDSAFSGEGARRTGGRWNYVGTPVVYSSATLSLACLELLVHADHDDLPDDLVAVPLVVPDDASLVSINIDDLPANWREYPAPDELREIGSQWISSSQSLILQVPSAVIPQESNLLINPSHPEFPRCAVRSPLPFPLDPRLWR